MAKIAQEIIVQLAIIGIRCKCQYKNAQKVEYKNVQFPYLSSSA